MKKHLAHLAILTVLSSTIVSAENWPQWRGTAFNGTSSEKGLPTSWAADAVKWKATLPGPSGATPAVWGDHVFVPTADVEKNLRLLCFDRTSGKVRWDKQLATGDINKGKGNMASPSPVTDGKTVWQLFGTGDLVALDFDGKEIWRRNLGADYGKFAIMWIYGSSPLLLDGKLYIQVLQRTPAPADYPGLAGAAGDRESYLLALDSVTGKTLWKHVRPSPATMESLESYATPVPHLSGGKKQLLIVGGDCLTGHDPATGAELWRGYGLNRKKGEWMRIVTSPVSAGELAIAAGPKKEPLIAFKTDQKGDISESGVAWTFDQKKTPDVCTPVYLDGKLYVLDGDSQTLTCLEAKTGAQLWQGQLPERGVIRASPTCADGKLYIVNEKGTVFVCATGDKFEVLSTIPMGGPEGTRASVAISSGNLFIRTPDTLYCVGK